MPITAESFRDVLRHFPSGVTVVTIKSPGSSTPHGLTVSAFASISPDPPLVLVSIDHRSTAHTMLEIEGATFAVNILSEDQEEMSNRFAWSKHEDRFAVGNWGVAVTGAPILRDSLAWLDCTVYARHSAGTHTIYIGEVQASNVPRPNDQPLIYWNRGYRKMVAEAGQTD